MLTDTEQLSILIDRWASRRGPFPEAHGAVVCELEDVTAVQPVTLEGLQGYTFAFLKVLGSVYKSLRHLDHHLDHHVGICRFVFGEAGPGGAPMAGLTVLGGPVLEPLIRFDSDKLVIAKPAKRYQWIQAAAILDADEVFGELVEMGF
jgi:hypothetical protein